MNDCSNISQLLRIFWVAFITTYKRLDSKFVHSSLLPQRSLVNFEVAGKTMRHTRTIIGPFSVFPNSYKLFVYHEVCFSHNIIRCRSDIIHLYRIRMFVFHTYSKYFWTTSKCTWYWPIILVVVVFLIIQHLTETYTEFWWMTCPDSIWYHNRCFQ